MAEPEPQASVGEAKGNRVLKCAFAVVGIMRTLVIYGILQAFKYVSFPVQTLAKCTKMIPIMLCLWSIDGWEKRKEKSLQAPYGRPAPLVGETKVQFHNDQVHLLVSHESQLAIYDGKLDCV